MLKNDGDLLRRFHADVRRLKRLAEQREWALMTLETATENARCILSTNDYDIGEPPGNCDPEAESYFLEGCDFEEWCDYND